jgi:hypothetical protein
MRLGAWSALFALTIQLVLSFGHVHFDGISTQSVSPRAVSARTIAAPRALRWEVQPAAKLQDAPAVPTPHKPINLAEDYCAICSVMRLAGPPAVAPVLPLATENRRMFLDGSVGFALAASPHLFFQARAPPQA